MANELGYIYDAKDVHLSIDGRVVQNFQDGDMFNVTVKEERVRTAVDAQGWPSIAINNNRLGQITVNLSGNSVDHKRLNQLANTNKVFALVATTPYEKFLEHSASFLSQLTQHLVRKRQNELIRSKFSICKSKYYRKFSTQGFDSLGCS